MKDEAVMLAYYYIILAVGAVVSSTFEFWSETLITNFAKRL